MAQTRITVSFTPAEFDLVRNSLEWVRKNQDEVGRDNSVSRTLRDLARKDAFLLGEILTKLK